MELRGELAASSSAAQTTLSSLIDSATGRYLETHTPFPILAPTLSAEGKNTPERFAQGFARFQEWLMGSLDKYKAELVALSYPLFALSYLKVRRRAAHGAAAHLGRVPPARPQPCLFAPPSSRSFHTSQPRHAFPPSP